MNTTSDTEPDADAQGDARAAGTDAATVNHAPAASLAAVAALLAACGGGGDGGTAPAPAPAPPPVAAAPTRTQAARFLAQASLASRASDIERVQTLGYSGWLDEQMALPRSSTNVEWLRSRGLDAAEYRNGFAGADNMLWRKLIASPDPLRQRVALALSEIVVVGMSGIASLGFRAFAAGYFMDLLEANAFGNYRTLLEEVSRSPAMGSYLTFRGNRKAAGQSVPDENYARELMQLFTVGLVQLNPDGTPRLGSNGQPQDTYTQDDVTQLARVFTGWDLDTSVGTNDTPDRSLRPMLQVTSRHELGEKKFLGTTIPANTDGVRSLTLALDTLMAHPNVAPFVGRQMIQRLVTSNPSAAYIGRVAAAFNNNGSGVKGDLRATLRAVLLDTEARSDSALADPAFGKLREPVLRFVQWARTYQLADPSGAWALGDLSDPAQRLGQSPLRAPSVFNFFRPGYVVPNSGINAGGNRTVPEFQITTESSVAGYVNSMQRYIGSGIGGLRGDYTALGALVADSAALLAELNVTLAAGQLSAATLAALKPALDTIAVTTAAGQANRIYAAVTLVMAAPEYITLK